MKETPLANHLSVNDLRRYDGRMMTADELLAADGHLQDCPVCAAQFRKEGRSLAASVILRASIEAAEDEHLLIEEISAYVGGELDEEDQKLLEEHITGCNQCFSRVAATRLVAARPDLNSEPVARSLTRRRLAALLDRPVYGALVWIGSALAIASIIVWLMTASFRSQLSLLKTRLSQLEEANQGIEKRFSDVSDEMARLKDENTTLRSHGEVPGASLNSTVWVLNDGGAEVALDRNGNVAGLNSLPPSYRQAVRTALLKERINTDPVITRLLGKRDNLMGKGGDSVFALSSPVGTVVQTDRPIVRWTPVGGSAEYIVTVSSGNIEELAVSPPLTQTEWRIPLHLARGRIYELHVRAVVDGKEITTPAPEQWKARFKVIEARKMALIDQAKQSFGTSHLAAAIIYASAGLLDDAELELEALLAANPQSRIAKKLLSSVTSLREGRRGAPR